MKRIIFVLIVQFIFLLNHSLAQQWRSVGWGVDSNGTVSCLKVIDSILYVGGGFQYIGGQDTINYSNSLYCTSIAKWDSIKWDTLKNFYNTGGVQSIEKYKNELYIGGGFIDLSLTPWRKYLAKLDSSNNWSDVGNIGYPNSDVNCVKSKDTLLFVAGYFNMIGNNYFSCIGKFDGTNWHRLGNGFYGGFQPPYDMKVYNDQLIVGGGFHYAGDTVAFGVATWNGYKWSPLDTGINNNINAMEIDTINNFLYVGGVFSYAGGSGDMIKTYNIAKWDGYKWQAVGNDSGGIFYSGINCLKMYHRELFACGTSNQGNESDTIIAKWDGHSWQKIDGPDETVMTLEVYKDELYAGGYFKKVGDTVAYKIARYYSPLDTSCDYLHAILYPQDATYYMQDSIAVQFYNNVTHPLYWQWDFGDGTIDSIQKPLHYYVSTETFPVSVIVNYQNCIDTTSSYITIKPCDSLNAFVHAYEDTLLYSSGNPPEATFYSNPNADSWQWDFGDGSTGTGFSNSHNYDTAGTYTISVIVKFGNCIDTGSTTITIINTAGINEYFDDITYLWQNIPNPFDNNTSIPYYVPYGSKGFLQIIDVKGELLDEYALQHGKNTLSISLEYLKAGTYFYNILIDGKKKDTKKMILQ